MPILQEVDSQPYDPVVADGLIDSRGRDHRDACLEELSDSEAFLRERVASLEADIAIYRTIACEAVARCAELAQRVEWQQLRLESQRDELRRYTASVIDKTRRGAE